LVRKYQHLGCTVVSFKQNSEGKLHLAHLKADKFRHNYYVCFMKNTLLPLVVSMLLVLASCGPTPPSEEDVRTRIMGAYCADNGNYRLELKDSTYFNRKVVMGPQGLGPNRESCNGLYRLSLENDQWILQFEKDNRPKTVFEDCEKTMVIWTAEKGFTNGTEETITIEDLIDGKTLTKGACDD
jgi:hypothetical protein